MREHPEIRDVIHRIIRAADRPGIIPVPVTDVIDAIDHAFRQRFDVGLWEMLDSRIRESPSEDHASVSVQIDDVIVVVHATRSLISGVLSGQIMVHTIVAQMLKEIGEGGEITLRITLSPPMAFGGVIGTGIS